MTPRFLAVSAGLVVAVTLPGCGSSSPTVTTTTTTTTLPSCTQTIALQGSGSLPPLSVGAETFTTTATARMDVTVDWTFASSTIGVYVVTQNSCNDVDRFNARTCNFVIRSDGGAKPRKVSASSVAPGAYDLLIANFSDQDESVSGQVAQSSAGCPALTSATATRDTGPAEVRRMSRDLLHR